MSPIEFTGDDIVIDGVPGKQLVGSLKAAGLSDEAVTELLGRVLARAPLATAAAAAEPFEFNTKIARTAPECATDYSRGFFHPDFFDGLTVVQAGQTPEELGFNFRFHAIEGEFDAIADNLTKLSNCLAELRMELFDVTREIADKITEIEARLQTKGKEKEGKDTKEGKEKEKEDKEGKDKEKEDKEGKDKEKESKEGKEKESKEASEKAVPHEKIQPAEKIPDFAPPHGPSGLAGVPVREPGEAPAASRRPRRRAFIRPEERPAVGEQALRAGGSG
jgi:hypothetical protein